MWKLSSVEFIDIFCVFTSNCYSTSGDTLKDTLKILKTNRTSRRPLESQNCVRFHTFLPPQSCGIIHNGVCNVEEVFKLFHAQKN